LCASEPTARGGGCTLTPKARLEARSKADPALDQSHPTSIQATEGRALTAQLEASQAKDNAAWELAVGGMREKWIAAETARLRAESEKALQATVEQNWASAQDALRAEWEKR
jgi:hypothetical protein